MTELPAIPDTHPTAARPASVEPDVRDERPRRPRIRVAAIVWGLILAALGAGAVWLGFEPTRVDDAIRAAVAAGSGSLVIVALGGAIAVGAVILLGSVLAAIRRRQERG